MEEIIRPASKDDAVGIISIYNHYIANTCATFETEPVTLGQMEQRIADAISAQLPWLVVRVSEQILGYAYTSMWKGRCAYRFSVESTIYLAPTQMRKGIGTLLYSALIEAINRTSMRSVIGGIALPNEASVRLHERLGFKKVGHFEKVGFKQEQWVDVGYWQLSLPRDI